jgi:hypothetical protein
MEMVQVRAAQRKMITNIFESMKRGGINLIVAHYSRVGRTKTGSGGSVAWN